MEGKWYGPVPIKRWLKDFAPKPSKRVRTTFACEAISFAGVGSTTEGEGSFVKAIIESKVLQKYNLYCKDTHELYGRDSTASTDPEAASLLSPDVCFFDFDMPLDASDEERLERLLGDTLCFGDLKSENTQDPCLHITSPSDRRKIYKINVTANDSKKSFSVRGQFISYARAICANSHRTCLYGFVILPDYARLLIFDQSGVCYSELFKWRDEPYLADFLQLFAAASDVGRGIDTSVTKIRADDKLVKVAETIFKEAERTDSLPDGVDFESVFKTFKADHATYWRCDVYDDRLKIFHRVLTYRVHTATPYFAGRATRGFIAVDLDRPAVVYMKRSWRINLPDFPKERDTYEEFAAAGVPHLPDCYFGGDVPFRSGQYAKEYFKWKTRASEGARWTPHGGEITHFVETKISEYVDTKGQEDDLKDARRGATGRTDLKDVDIEMLPHVLTVTLFGKIGSRLRDFKSSRHLCTALMHALETHEAALRLTKTLHRDISSGNILIYKVPGRPGVIEGLLIDWDLCVKLANIRAARRKGRTGTWEFMSARMLKDPKGCVHEARDDFESIAYLLYHHTLRYSHTVAVPQKAELCHELREVFNRAEKTEAGITGGTNKANFLRKAYPTIEKAIEATQPQELQRLLKSVRNPFGVIYSDPPDAVEGDSYSQQELVRHVAHVADTKEKLTHELMLGFFRSALAEDKMWLGDRPSQDQYPFGVRETMERGRRIDDHYELSEAGALSVHNRTSMRTSTKRKAESNVRLYYAAGSGHRSGSSGVDSDFDFREIKRKRGEAPSSDSASEDGGSGDGAASEDEL